VRRFEKRLNDASVRWRYGHAMAVPHDPPSPGRHAAVMVLDHLRPGPNIGAILRTASVFDIHEVHIVGTPYFETATATDAIYHVPMRRLTTVAESLRLLRESGYTIFVLENTDDAGPNDFLHRVALPEKSAFVVGNERHGISFSPRDFPELRWIMIQQFGHTRCLNVATAANLALYEYVRQHGASPSAD
jgi:tRNA G18 (ribose-2'-O)-methylase SpoU